MTRAIRTKPKSSEEKKKKETRRKNLWIVNAEIIGKEFQKRTYFNYFLFRWEGKNAVPPRLFFFFNLNKNDETIRLRNGGNMIVGFIHNSPSPSHPGKIVSVGVRRRQTRALLSNFDAVIRGTHFMKYQFVQKPQKVYLKNWYQA